MTKRLRTAKARPGQLVMEWARPGPRENPDICTAYGEGCARADSRLLMSAICLKRLVYPGPTFEPSLLEELEQRGYDLTTLRFSIRKKGVTG